MRGRERELRTLAEIAGLKNHVGVNNTIPITCLSRNPRWAAQLEKALRTRAAMLHPQPHPFLPAPSEADGVSSGDVDSGFVVGGSGRGPIFRPRFTMWNRHVGVFAPTGEGKSTIIAHQIAQAIPRLAAWIFDQEDEYSRYLIPRTSPDDLLVIDYSDFRRNFFGWPPNCDPREYLSKKTSSLRELLFLRDGSVNMLRQACMRLLGTKGIFSILDVYKEVNALPFRGDSRRAGYKESLDNRFSELESSMGETYGTIDSHDLDFLQTKPVIWRLHGLSADHRAIFVSDLMQYVTESRRPSYQQGPNSLWVLDEFPRLSTYSMAGRADISEPFLHDMLRSVRKLRIGIWLATQTPHLLPEPVLSNILTFYVGRPISGKFVAAVSRALGLDREQEEHLIELPRRQWLVRYPEFPRPFLIEMPSIEFRPLATDEEIRERAQYTLSIINKRMVRASLKGVELKSVPDDRRAETGHGDVVERVCRRLAEHPDESCAERCAAQGIDAATESAARKELGAGGGRGLIEVDGRVGNRVFFRLTAKGRAAAEEKGYKVWRGHASPTHEWVVRRCLHGLGRSHAVTILTREHAVNGRRPDALFRFKDMCVALQVCSSPGNYTREARALLELAESPGVDLGLMVATHGQHARGVKRALKRMVGDVAWERVAVVEAAQALNPRFNWASVI